MILRTLWYDDRDSRCFYFLVQPFGDLPLPWCFLLPWCLQLYFLRWVMYVFSFLSPRTLGRASLQFATCWPLLFLQRLKYIFVLASRDIRSTHQYTENHIITTYVILTPVCWLIKRAADYISYRLILLLSTLTNTVTESYTFYILLYSILITFV